MARQSVSVAATPTSESWPPLPEERVRVEIVERGYMDDPLNTDNCWKEVELWSVHYTPEANENLSVRPSGTLSESELPGKASQSRGS